MSAKAGLVPIQKLVIRHGQQFMTTVYVNPNKTNKVDHSKHVVVPDWKISTPQELEDEKNKIIKTKDPAEKEALKDEFLKHLKGMGVTWADNQNDAINFMRALMAAKDHLGTKGNATPNPTPQPAPQPNPTPQTAQPSVGGATMSKDDAKKLIKDMQKKDSVENIMSQMKSAGISWSEHANPAVNKMRAMMALNTHFQNGGTLGGNAQPAPQPQPQPTAPAPAKAPVTVQAKKPDKNAPKVGSTQEIYHNATIKSKAIGLVTGMIPKDADAEEFLHKQIREGKFADPGHGDNGGDYGLPKGMLQHLGNNGRVQGYIKADDFNGYSRPDRSGAKLFEDKGKKEYEDYKKNFEEYHSKYGSEILNDKLEYVKTVSKNLDTMDKYGMHITQGKTGQQYHKDLTSILSKISTASQVDLDHAWDELDMESLLDTLSLTNRNKTNPPLQQMLEFGFGGAFENLEYVQQKVLDELQIPNWRGLQTVLADVQSGKLGKKNVFVAFANAVENKNIVDRLDNSTVSMSNGSRANLWKAPLIPLMMDQSNLSYWGASVLPSSARYFDAFQRKTDNKTFNRAKFDDFVTGAIVDKAGLSTPEAKWVKHNLILYHVLSQASNDSYYGKYKMPENYEPVDFNDWSSSNNKLDVFKRHMAIMRKVQNTRDKWRKKLTPDKPKQIVDIQELHDTLKNGGDLSKLFLPEHNQVDNNTIKCAVEKVSANEMDTVDKKIQETHDRKNHDGFKTKVHGVYRVTNLAYEDKFNEIDKDRNHTGFYYHGTDYKAMQLILGKSGQFRVMPDPKAGRMLGDGIYLASQSSKSMQYISPAFNRGIGNRGVLFLCKASFGRTLESTQRKSTVNTRLLNQSHVDTLYMGRPHVANPEWAVKEMKAVIPRLIIDVEMVNP